MCLRAVRDCNRRPLASAGRSIICLCLRHRQIIDLLATDKSRYFAQHRPIIHLLFAVSIHHNPVLYFKLASKLHKFPKYTMYTTGSLTFLMFIYCVVMSNFSSLFEPLVAVWKVRHACFSDLVDCRFYPLEGLMYEQPSEADI